MLGPFLMKGREASDFYGREGPMLWLGRRWQALWWPSPAAGLGEASRSCITSPPAAVPNSVPSPCLEVSMGLRPRQCSSEFWLSWGHRLCGTSQGPHRGGMVIPGLAVDSAQGAGGHRGHEWLNRIIPESPAFKWDPQSRFSFSVT